MDILVNSAATPWSAGPGADLAATSDDIVRREVEINGSTKRFPSPQSGSTELP
ncbi:hypothetical protein IU433_16905 [Nocardia puris]|nr:hypothetical protein [Nocardia puris]MBF6365643.1 hypothetical protein [Nocardia puris]MBF6460714.1 hypothetical protein [Nocardia puris]